MTQPPPHPPAPSPFGEDTDEALSALIDGELAAFAADHGLTEGEVRSRLEDWPGYPERVAALQQARAAIGEPVPPLDDLTRRRLVRQAVPAADGIGATSERSDRSWLRISAAAAAAVIVLAGIGAMLTSLGTGDDTSAKSSSVGGSVAAAEPERGDLGNVGDVTNPAAIRALLDPSTAPKAPPSSEFDSQSGGGSEGSAADAAGGSTLTDGGDQQDLASRSAAPLPQDCAAQLAGSRPVRFFATGTYQGQPVTIVGIDSGGRTIAFVVAAGDCTKVLTSISR